MRNVRFFFLVLGGIWLLLGGSGDASAAVIRVKATATGTGNGTSWANAYTTLPAALTAAVAGDEIWVAAGTYKPTTDTNRAKSFEMKTSVAIYGGFAGSETARDQRNWKIRATILSGDIGTQGNAADNTYRVVIGAKLAVLDGFTITAGGVYSGAGMFNSNCSPTVANCSFIGNSGSDGGAMYNYNGAAPTVSNCSFNGNSATGKGGAIYNRTGGVPTFINCTFSGNTGLNGGAIYNEYCPAVVFNCTFSGNTANAGGGAMYSFTNSLPTVTNCIFWGNSATTGAEILNNGGTPTFSHCDIKGSGASGASWKSALGSDGGGNIDADPLFVNAAQPAGPDGLWRTGDDGFVLQALSPCLNAGLATGAPANDILGNPRDSKPDLGAYERQSIAPTAAVGELTITYRLTKASTVPQGQTVQYTYHWTSDKGDNVTHGPTTATSDTLTETNLVQAGETWTVTVTPSSGGLNGPTTTAKVKILDPKSGVLQWILYR